MGRMHNPGKGISRRSLPYSRQAPRWVKAQAKDIKEQIIKMARKGFFPSQIGVVLRDTNATPQVQAITGTKILRILKANGLAPRLPEDLYHMIKQAVIMRKHLAINRKDKDAKFRLILLESRIHRLARYYRSKRQLPPNWRYDSSNASTLVA